MAAFKNSNKSQGRDMFKLMVGALLVGSVSVTHAQAVNRTAARPVVAAEATAGASRASTEAASPGGSAEGPAVAMKWEIRASDVTLARTFERWAAAAGHKLKWDAARNFLVGATDTYTGSFEGALVHVLSSPGIRYSDYPLEACIYANTPPLVRITRQGEQSRECTPTVTP